MRAAKREETIGAAPEALPGVLVLHERRLLSAGGRPTRDTIDHLVIAPSGVWVVDAKTHYGPAEVRRSGGILTPRVERLFINNRDQTQLIEGLNRQVAAVERVLAAAGREVTVRGAMCFVGTTLPWVSEWIADVPLVGRRDLVKLVQADGPLSVERRAEVAAALASWFIAA